MNKKEAVEILKELPDRIFGVIMPNEKSYDYKGALNFATKQLEADRWIPVSERLPNTLGVYNVARKITEGETNYVISTACYFDGQDTWHDDNRVNHDRPYITDVIAWKSKPEPYESEAENETDN